MNPPRTPAAQRRRDSQRPDGESLRATIYDVIFESDTPAGLWFDIGLLVAILASVLLVSLETVGDNTEHYPNFFWYSEWFLTILFTIEYGLRLYCVRRPLRYALSFWGIIDLLSILPTYIAAIATFESAGSFVVIRSIRLLRVFRVLKLWRLMSEADELSATIWLAREKIIVFIAVVLVAVSISGTLMYVVETLIPGNPPNGQFTSIPQSMYWATVTMTTVGYGDIVPKTAAGKIISAALILLGYSLIIVPSGFVAAEFTARRLDEGPHEPECANCQAKGQRADAEFCYRCGAKIHS
jgi:voltage-gated potassium channel